MTIKNEKCCFMQYPYPDKSVFFVAIGEKYELTMNDVLLGNTGNCYEKYMGSLKNIHIVARSEADAIREIKEHSNNNTHIYGIFSLSEILKIKKGLVIPETYVVSVGYDWHKKDLESFYYKCIESHRFIKIQADSILSARNYLSNKNQHNGLLIKEDDLDIIFNNMKMVQEGKIFGHYCLSEEEEREEAVDEEMLEKVS